LIGPIATLLHAQMMGAGLYQMAHWGVVALRLATLVAWLTLCLRVAADGVEAEEQVLQ
jgi:hypothetical protein